MSSDKNKYNVRLKAELDFRVLGAKLKEDMKVVAATFSSMSDEELTKFQAKGVTVVAGHSLTTDEVRLKYAFGEDKKGKGQGDNKGQYDAHSDGEVSLVLKILNPYVQKQESNEQRASCQVFCCSVCEL